MADTDTRIVISATDQTRAAFDSAVRGLESLKVSAAGMSAIVASATAALASLAVVAKFEEFVKGAAALDDMAEKTGATVEALSALASVARVSGVSIETVEGGLIKFAKALNGVNDETKSIGKAFAALALDPKQLRTLDTAEAFKVLADRLAEFRDDSSKTALVLELLGKNGAQLLPYLKDLAQTGDLQAKVTAEQAAQAENLEKNLNRLFATKNAGFKEFSTAVLPTVDAFVKAMLDAANASDGLRKSIRDLSQDGTLGEWAETTALGLAFVIDTLRLMQRLAVEIATPFQRLGQNIYNLGQLIGIAMSGNLQNIKTAYKLAVDEAQKEFAKLDQRLADNRAPTTLFADRVKAQFEALRNAAPATGDGKRDSVNFTAGKDGVEKMKDELKAVQSFVDQIGERLVGAVGGEFEQLRQRARDVFKKVDVEGLPAAEAERLSGMFEKVNRQIDELDRRAANLSASRTILEGIAAANAANDQADEALRSFNQAQRQAAADMEFELSLVGKLAAERQKLVAVRRIEAAERASLARVPENAANKDDRIAGITAKAEEAREATTRALDSIRDRSRSTWVGATMATQEYFDRVTNGAENMRFVFSNAFQRMEDVLVKFTTTGKLDFKGLVDSILTDIARIQIRQNITAPLAKALGGFNFGGLFGGGQVNGASEIPFFADGGRPRVGMPAIVGERGPEVFIPDVAGTVIPNHALGGNSVTVVQHINVDSRSDRASILQAMSAAAAQAKAEILDSMNRGGAFAR